MTTKKDDGHVDEKAAKEKTGAAAKSAGVQEPAATTEIGTEGEAALAVAADGPVLLQRSRFRFRTGRYINVPVENVPSNYLRDVLAGAGEVHTVTIDLTSIEKLAVMDVLEKRAAGVETIPVDTEGK